MNNITEQSRKKLTRKLTKRTIISFRFLVAGVAVLSISTLLSGCTGFIQPATNEPTIEQKCQNSTILYTDLTKPKNQRIYILPSKELCPTEVQHEKV